MARCTQFIISASSSSFPGYSLHRIANIWFPNDTKKNMPGVTYFTYFNLFLSLFFYAPFVDGKTNQCRAIDNSSLKSLIIPEKYSVNVEVKLINERTVLLIREDHMKDMTSLKVINISHVVHCIYYYPQKQLIRYIKNLKGIKQRECLVYHLESKTPCVPNSPWTIPLHELRQIKNFTWFPEKKEFPRGIETLHLELCDYYDNHTIRLKLDAYLADNWNLPRTNVLTNLIRLEFRLSKATVISDYIDFFTNTKEQDFLLPRGTFCPGLNNSKAKLPEINTPFSVNSEIIDLKEIKNERLVFDDDKKLVLFETESRNVSLGTKRVIYDYNAGYKYTVFLPSGQCQRAEKMRLADYFVKGCHENNLCKMSNPDNYFHTDSTEVQYVGKREVRGVLCEVWVGQYKDFYANEINTIEWYFTSKTWTESNGNINEDLVIFRMDIWESGSQIPSIHNFFNFYTDPTDWSNFDISPCYSQPNESIRFTIRLKASGDQHLLPHTKDNTAIQHLQQELASLGDISPILLSQIIVEYDTNKSVVYLTSTLLSGPKESNKKLTHKKMQPLKSVFEKLSKRVKSKTWQISLPVRHRSKSENLKLIADTIWKTVQQENKALRGRATTKKQSPSLIHTSTQRTTLNTISSVVTSGRDTTWATRENTNSETNKNSSSEKQTKIASMTSVETLTDRPITSSSVMMTESETVDKTSDILKKPATTVLTEQRRITTEISSKSELSPEITQTLLILDKTTKSTVHTTAVQPKLRTSSTPCCVCSAGSSIIPSHTLDEETHLTKATLIACICGSFVVGALFAVVIVRFHSVFCRRKSDPNKNSDVQNLMELSYSQLE